MNDQSQYRLRHYWLGWIAMLAFVSVLSPINIHFVIAQDLPGVVIAPADPGQPTASTQAPATPAVATEVAIEVPTATTSTPADVPPVVEPVSAVAPVPTPDVPVTPSEVTSDTDIGTLIPIDEPLAESVASKKTKPDPESVRTLSVEPGVRPMLPEDRPAWVGASSDFTSAQHFLYVGSLPTSNRSEADEALDEPLIAAVRNYIDQEVVNQFGSANSMPVTAEFIRRNLIDNPEGFECELTTGQDPLFQKWVAVRITPEQRELFRQWHTEATQRTRLAPLGVGLVAVLSVISLSHVVLRRFRGASQLAMVNQQLPEQVASRKTRTRSTAAKLIFFALLLSAVAFAFLLPLFAKTAVRVKTTINSDHSDRNLPYEVTLPALHKEIRIDTLDGSRTIILEHTSHQ